MALNRTPEIAAKLERITILGGSWGLGNKTAAAEWNILCDPEAAHVVLSAGIPVTMIPIDALNPVGITPDLIKRIRAIGGTIGDFATELLQSLVMTFRPGNTMAPKFMPLNDPVASLVAAQPKLAQTQPARVDVELAGHHTYGRTVIDFGLRDGAVANVDVVTQLNCDQTINAFVDALTRLANLDI
jgi:inosine-uridine nucleoside N-ribohydrolase